MKNKTLARSFKLGAVLSFVLATGCAEVYKRNLELMQGTGSEFSQRLAEEYKTLGDTEHQIMYDEVSAAMYYEKAMKAKIGCPVPPSEIPTSGIDEEKIPELTKARLRLIHDLEKGAWEVAPKTAAHAQAYFDCWVEQQYEGWQKHDIAACRSEYYEAIADVEIMLKGGAMAVTPNAMTFFDFGSSHLNADALKTIHDVAERVKLSKLPAHVHLIGRTDKAGDAKHNKNLSNQRATMVKKELIRLGIAPHFISIQAAGETPGPNVEGHNRRVDIILFEEK